MNSPLPSLTPKQVTARRGILTSSVLLILRNWPEVTASSVVFPLTESHIIPIFVRTNRLGRGHYGLLDCDRGEIRRSTRSAVRFMLGELGLDKFGKDVVLCAVIHAPHRLESEVARG